MKIYMVSLLHRATIKENHVIGWENDKVIDRESDKAGKLIREAIWIRKNDNMNRDEGSNQLSHVWDKLLHTDDRHWKSVKRKQQYVFWLY